MKMTAAIVTAFAASVGFGTVASAGEVTGSSKLTPVNDGRANSICAFSGLEDFDDLSSPAQPGVVQTFGSVGPSQTPGPVVAELAKSGFIKDNGPGTACRGGGPGGG